MAVCSIRNVAIFWSAIFLGVSYFLYSPVPNGFAEPWRLRTILAGFKVVALTGVISEKLGYESSINFTRRALEMAYYPTSKNDPELKVTDTLFDGVSVRIYQPINLKTPAPALVYFHGGGWVLLSVDSYDVLTSHIAKGADIIVISVDYRRAPEHPFPIPFDDCVTATIHLLQNAAKYGVDPSRVAIGGDSAGGNLAAAVGQRLSIEPETFIPKLRLQLLVYPALQATDFNLPSFLQNNGMGGILSKTLMIEFWLQYMNKANVTLAPYLVNNQHTSSMLKHSQYADYVDVSLLPKQIQSRAQRFEYRDEDVNTEFAYEIEDTILNPYFAPLMAVNLSQVPPAYILNAEYDVLRDDGLIYGQRLRQAGVKVHMHNVRHAHHGIFGPFTDSAILRYEIGKQALVEVNKYLKAKLYK